MHELIKSIQQKPVIAALRSSHALNVALASSISTLFYLHASIFDLTELTQKAKQHNKNVFFHMEFIDGLGRDSAAISYIAKTARPDGIITTRVNSIKDAKDAGLFTVQRFFMVDKQSYDTAVKNAQVAQPDLIEIMPGIIPQVIRQMAADTKIPVIAGGLITTKDEAFSALQAGAFAISTGTEELWNMYK